MNIHHVDSDESDVTRERLLAQVHSIAEEIRLATQDPSALMILDDDPLSSVDVISTGSMAIDQILGVGGFPLGSLIELYGDEGSCKTSIALSTIAQAQRKGILCAIIDAEYATLDMSWTSMLGVDTGLLLVSQCNCTEQVFEITLSLLDKGVGLVVIDSIASTASRLELQLPMGEVNSGWNAQLIGQAVKNLIKKVTNNNQIVIFINQLRDKINVVYGDHETTPGGKILKYNTAMRLDVRRIGYILDGQDKVGITVRAYVSKNRLAPPFRTAELNFLFSATKSIPERGFDNAPLAVAQAIATELFQLGPEEQFRLEELEDGFVTVPVYSWSALGDDKYEWSVLTENNTQYQREVSWVGRLRKDPKLLDQLMTELKR